MAVKMAQRLATQTEVETVMPAATGLAAALVAEMMALAGTQFDLETWGEKASYGHALLSAHYLATASGAGGGENAPALRRKADGLETQYAASLFSENVRGDYVTTKYGRMYQQLAATVQVWPIAGV